jgi:ABC-type uncharacterized transport system permease subunit
MLIRPVAAPALNADQFIVAIAVHIAADATRTRYPGAPFFEMKNRAFNAVRFSSETRLCLYFCSHLIPPIKIFALFYRQARLSGCK